MIDLKNILIDLGLCVDDIYLNMYVNLITNNLDTTIEKYKTQRHHIIPRCYFKKNNIDIDNSPSNVVILSHKDHLLAHYYLSLCAKEDWFKYMNELSVRYCYNHIDEKDFINSLDEYQHLMEDVNKRISLKYKNKRWIYKNNIELNVDESDLSTYLNDGWSVGRLYRMSDETKEKIASKIRGTHHTTSEETKRKIGEANKGKRMSEENKMLRSNLQKSKVWYNNGYKEKHIYKEYEKEYIELGWTKGRIPMSEEQKLKLKMANLGKPQSEETKKKRASSLRGVPKKPKDENVYKKWLENQRKAKCGKHWYNNGEIEHQYFECPLGWNKGRLKNKGDK